MSFLASASIRVWYSLSGSLAFLLPVQSGQQHRLLGPFGGGIHGIEIVPVLGDGNSRSFGLQFDFR